MPSDSSDSSTFHEEQALQPARRRWIIAIVPATLTALAAGQLRLGHPLFTHAPSTGGLMTLAVLLWAVYVWLSRVRLVTDVDERSVSLRLRGLSRHHAIPRARIVRASAVTFDPDREFGGYGIRNLAGGRAYVGVNRQGIRVELDDKSFVVIGSGVPDRILAAIAGEKAR